MKKILTSIVAALLLIGCLLTATGCKKDPKRFGQFSYNDIWLYSFATTDISYARAKELVQSDEAPAIMYEKDGAALLASCAMPISVNPADPMNTPLPSETLVDSVLSKYASVEIVTKYYVTNEKDQQEKIDFLQGTDLKNMLRFNEYAPFGQLVTKGIIVFDELVDFMQAENDKFVENKQNTVAPFNTIFTYHTDDEGNVVIQTRDFAEIPSSVGGGVGCSYRQDTEQLYDSENKLVKWQTSLGVYTATPNGTLQQGYILEVEFHWNQKQ